MKNCSEQGKIPRYDISGQYIITDAISKTSVGKVDKKLLRAIYVSAS